MIWLLLLASADNSGWRRPTLLAVIHSTDESRKSTTRDMSKMLAPKSGESWESKSSGQTLLLLCPPTGILKVGTGLVAVSAPDTELQSYREILVPLRRRQPISYPTFKAGVL